MPTDAEARMRRLEQRMHALRLLAQRASRTTLAAVSAAHCGQKAVQLSGRLVECEILTGAAPGASTSARHR